MVPAIDTCSCFFGGGSFAGQSRAGSIPGVGSTFSNCMRIPETQQTVERMAGAELDGIMGKRIEVNVAYPFMEGIGCSACAWLDSALNRPFNWCTDVGKIDRNECLLAMRRCVSDSTRIEALLLPSCAAKSNDRAMCVEGIGYPYYYEPRG